MIFLCKIFFDTYVVCDEDYNKHNVNSDFNNHYLTMYFYLLKKNNINLLNFISKEYSFEKINKAIDLYKEDILDDEIEVEYVDY